MRLLHTADWHLGRTIRGRSRAPEFEAVLDEICGIAVQERVDVFIVAGDISHTALQSPLFQTQEANGIRLADWTWDFLRAKPGWFDIVEDAVVP